ncbi:B-cell receptor CD22-like [Clarias gariepinus]
MELRPLCVMILLISLIQVGQVQVLSAQPNLPQIFSGETVTLTCSVPGGSRPYYWYKDGVNVHRSNENTYNIKVYQSHRYECQASRDGGEVAWSNEVTLSVIERPKAVLTLQPDGQIFSGQEVTFTCEISGHADTEWTYIWCKDGVQLSSYSVSRKYSFSAVESSSGKYTCSGRRKDDSQTSETSNAVTLTVSDVTHTGKYTCRGTERGGSHTSHNSDAVTLTVSGAPVSGLRLISSLVTVSVYLILTIILAEKCYRFRAQTDRENTQIAFIEE